MQFAYIFTLMNTILRLGDNKLAHFFEEDEMYTVRNATLTGGVYTDLACERRRVDPNEDGVTYKKEYAACGLWERIEITSKAGERSIGRPMGYYDTLLLPRMDLCDEETVADAISEISGELTSLTEKMRVVPERILVVGLGNASLTPDSIGVTSAGSVKPTSHLRDFDESVFLKLACSEISVIRPGVLHETGIDTLCVVRGIAERIRPDLIIAIDSLAARSAERLGTTVQISSTGITPGGGIGSPKMPINESTAGAPVIAIGVPTVMDSDYFLVDEMRRPEGRSAMFVAPKEINEIVAVAADIISGGINRAFGLYRGR